MERKLYQDVKFEVHDLAKRFEQAKKLITLFKRKGVRIVQKKKLLQEIVLLEKDLRIF
ncbi:MAG: hypothetical protein ACI86H_000642 [bacterium]|jgi:hypothetical protein